MTPPVGGAHDKTWMTCDGTVYTETIRDENAVHCLELHADEPRHPAVRDDHAVACGHQLSVETASDPRVRNRALPAPGASPRPGDQPESATEPSGASCPARRRYSALMR
ncbi:DUF3105 domain-containing protein [Streptomyces sp. NPDC050164]|uniref:DUF3105 domain-containing protein n=1 Tax=Streptomyces sp. NPDC050164 TaxID=3365605 RepID=UPI0037AABEC8